LVDYPFLVNISSTYLKNNKKNTGIFSLTPSISFNEEGFTK